MERSPENDSAAIKAAELYETEKWLRLELRSRCALSRDQAERHIESFKKRVKYGKRTPKEIAEDIIQEYFSLLE